MSHFPAPRTPHPAPRTPHLAPRTIHNINPYSDENPFPSAIHINFPPLHLALLSFAPSLSDFSDQQSSYIIAKTENGKLRGIRNRGVNIFKGIPYAGKVSGDRNS